MMRSVDFLDKVTFTFIYNAEAINEDIYSKIILDRMIRELSEMFYKTT